MSTDSTANRYLGDDYLNCNPTWDQEDSPWKATLVRDALDRENLRPTSIAEIGCGAGGVLAALRPYFPEARLSGFDIAPAATRFWVQHANKGITFTLGDFLEITSEKFDVVLLLDVLEHLTDPHGFLKEIKFRADFFVFHFPLDLSVVSVLREKPLLHVRRKVGHIHYFTKSLALALLSEAGFVILDWHYSGAAFTAPKRTLKTRFAAILRRLVYTLNHDVGARLLGGETLVVTAIPRGAVR